MIPAASVGFQQATNNSSFSNGSKKPRLEQDDRQPANIVQNFLSKGQQTTTYSIPNPVLTDSATQQLSPSQAFQRATSPPIRVHLPTGVLARSALPVPIQSAEANSAIEVAVPAQAATPPASKDSSAFEAGQPRQKEFCLSKTVEENALSSLQEANKLLANRQLEKAIEILEKALLNLENPAGNRASNDTNARLYNVLGKALGFSNKPDAAIKIFNKGLALQNISRLSTARLHGSLGFTFVSKNELPSAAEEYKKAILYTDAQHVNAFYFLQLGKIFNELGDKAQVVNFLKQGVVLECPPQLKADITCGLGTILREIGRTSDALDAFNAGSSIEGIGDKSKVYFLTKSAELHVRMARDCFLTASRLPGISGSTEEQLTEKIQKIESLFDIIGQ